MYRRTAVLLLAALIAGCATPKRPSNPDWYAKEHALRQAYKDCLKKAGGDRSQCKQQKSALTEQMEWDLLEESD